MKKKVLLSLIVCFVLIFMFGCSNVEASIKYVVQDGRALIVQAVDVNINRDELIKAGYDPDVVLSEMMTYADQFVSEKEQAYNSFLREIAQNQTKYAKSINTRFANSLETFSYLNVYKITETKKGFRIQKEFGNIYCFMVFNDYNMFYVGCPECQGEIEINVDVWEANRQNGIPNSYLCPHCATLIDDYTHYFVERLVDIPLDGELTVEQNAFVTSYLQECSTMFNDIYNLKFKDGTRLVDKFASICRGDFALEDTNLIYKFITPYKRVHSNGKVSKQGNYYVHTWNIKDPSTTITLSRITAKPTMWYVVSLCSAVGVVAIYFAVRIIVKKVKQHKKH